jgi:flagellar basal-body rod protein FlgG
MLRSIDLSRAGMLRQGQYLDATAHNLANTATPGFKAIRAALESGDVSPDANTAPDQATGTATPALSARLNVGRLFTQGSVRDTGRMTDLAITGDGFFTVRRPDGTEGYTRNGALTVDRRGRLADSAGNLLQPALTLPPGATGLRIGASGEVTATMPGGRTEPVGQLRLARFVNPQGLLAGPDGLFSATTASGAPQMAAPGGNGAGTVRSGALEDANSDITEQMTNLVAAQRAYQLNTSAFRMSDEMLRMANQMASNA